MSDSPYDQEFYEHQRDGSRRSAAQVLPIAFEWVGMPSSIVDVGCGVGTWLAASVELGVSDIVGLDGDYVDKSQLQIPAESFRPVDLTESPEQGRRFDLAMTLEVAEHLPPEAADGFVEFLVSLSDCVLFSAAVPGQGGVDHLNEQWPSYWAQRFLNHGYVALDPIRPMVWQNPNVERFYSQNAFLYIKKSVVEANARLKAEADRFEKQRLMLVYDNILLREPTVPEAARHFARAVGRSVRKRLGMS